MSTDWSAEFFQGIALELWRKANPPETTRAEADFLESALEREPGARLLDVPCGNGRLALELARRGYDLTGVEASPEFLAEAAASSGAGKAGISWLRGDMRALEGLLQPASFDAAFCFGNSFGYCDAAGTAAFLAGVGAALRPGGRFVLDTALAAESVLPDWEDKSWSQVDDITLLVERRYDPAQSRIEAWYTFLKEGKTERRRAWHWVFTVGEVRRMLAGASLATLELYGGLEREPYEPGAPRLLLVAEKARQG